LYQVIAESHGASVEHYDLLSDQGWGCDLDHMERLLLESSSLGSPARRNDRKKDLRRRYEDEDAVSTSSTEYEHGDGESRGKEIRGILINNPSNPTGACYSREHLSRIVALAERYRVPIIADEIYGDLTFGDRTFHPMADVAASMGYEVPIITASGLGKQCECWPVFLPRSLLRPPRAIRFRAISMTHLR
jgi:tyrosine aminotransferase